jgi:hypothetical protein
MVEYVLKLNSEDVNGIGAALMDAPYRVAAPIIEKINAQLATSHTQTPSEKALGEPLVDDR